MSALLQSRIFKLSPAAAAAAHVRVRFANFPKPPPPPPLRASLAVVPDEDGSSNGHSGSHTRRNVAMNGSGGVFDDNGGGSAGGSGSKRLARVPFTAFAGVVVAVGTVRTAIVGAPNVRTVKTAFACDFARRNPPLRLCLIHTHIHTNTHTHPPIVLQCLHRLGGIEFSFLHTLLERVHRRT